MREVEKKTKQSDDKCKEINLVEYQKKRERGVIKNSSFDSSHSSSERERESHKLNSESLVKA